MTLRSVILLSAFLMIPSAVQAEEYVQYASPAVGSDAVTQTMAKEGLFRGHEDDCDAGEEFIQIWENEDGTDIGFCMEEDERTPAEWTDARDICFNLGKRLPEPGEYKFACDVGGSLNYMTDDWEWSSNFASHLVTDDSSPAAGVAVPVSGNGSCNYASADWIASADGTAASRVFRCVR